MNYIGSKKRSLSFIKQCIASNVENIHQKVFCDLFSGTGIVAQDFRTEFGKIIANDLEYYAYVLARALVHTRFLPSQEKFDYLNSLPLKEGLIYSNFCSPAGRMYFSDDNGKKIDAIRSEIENVAESESEYFFLLASLLESADKVANTASVYASFLKELKKEAKNPLDFQPITQIEHQLENNNEVYNQDANELIREISGDVLYLDPPYNERQYGSNYHVLNAIAKYEEFIPQGKTGLPENYNKSSYCYSSTAFDSLDYLINEAEFEHIFINYYGSGIISKQDLVNMLVKFGEVKEFTRSVLAYMNNKHQKKKYLEFLFYLRKE